MADFSPEFSAKIREAYAQGHDPEEIIAHFETTKNPEGLKWASQLRELQGGSDVVPVLGPTSSGAPSFRDTSSPLMDTFTRNAELVKEESKDMSLKDQAIFGAEVLGGLYAGKKAIDIGSRMINNLTPQGRLEAEKARLDLELAKESSKNYAIQTQTAADKLNLEKQLAANAQPSSLEELKARALMNAEKRAQELHEFKMESLKQQQIKKATQVDKIAASPTIDPMSNPDIQQSTGFTGLTNLEKQTGGPITTGTDLRMIQQSEANRLAKEAEAKAAGVTPTTSVPEAETLVATKENSLTPDEKLQQKTSLAQPSSAVQGAVSPRTLPEIAQQPNISPTFQQHLVNQQKIVEANPKYQQELNKAYESGRIPKGYVFVPNMGNMDNNIFNTLGPEGRREALEAKGLTAFGQVAESKNMKYNDVVSKNIADYAQHLRDTIPSVELNTRQERIAKGEPHTTNYGRLVGVPDKEGKFFNKQMKIAGVGGGLMAISNLSQAKSIPEFLARGVDVGTDFLPLVGQIKQGLAPSEAGAPTLPPGAYTESRKLGSPFYKMFKEGAAPPSMR